MAKSRTNPRNKLELQHCRHFMRWVTMCEPTNVTRLDLSKDRKRPEFAFYYPSGQRYTLELTSWLTPELKKLQRFLQTNVAHTLQCGLPGTFVLYIPFNKLTSGYITKIQANRLVVEIEYLCNSQLLQQTNPLSIGRLVKVRDDGNKLVPVLTSPDTAYLDETSQSTKGLQCELTKILVEAQGKFRWYRGIRVLVLDIAQNGLDIDYHAGISKDGPGVVCRWISAVLNPSSTIHYVCLSQGMRIWSAGDFSRMLTGHIYENQPMPNYKEVWRKPSLLPILQSFVP